MASTEELDAWIRETSPRAVAFARSLLKDPHSAEDVVHDCYCRLLAKAATYDLPTDGTKLLMRSIVNAAINVKTRRRGWFGFGKAEDDEFEPADTRTLPPEANLAAGELKEAIAEALQLLPPVQRAAIELKSLEYSAQDIAEMLGTTTTNVGVLIHRARQTLAVALAPYLAPGETP